MTQVGLTTFADKNYCLEGVLAFEATNPSNGQWFSVQGLEKKTIHFVVTGVATAKLCISNEIDQPDNASDGVQFGTDVTQSSLVEMKSPVKWMKVMVTAGTGKVSAYIQGCP